MTVEGRFFVSLSDLLLVVVIYFIISYIVNCVVLQTIDPILKKTFFIACPKILEWVMNCPQHFLKNIFVSTIHCLHIKLVNYCFKLVNHWFKRLNCFELMNRQFKDDSAMKS